jgi:AraC family transcriptional regulator
MPLAEDYTLDDAQQRHSKNLIDERDARPYPEHVDQQVAPSSENHRSQWLALLQQYGVGRPKALHVTAVPGGLVQATEGEPPGRISLPGVPASVLMYNASPVQDLQQTRGGRSFVSDVLRGEMTLMPRGMPSRWSWNSACNRLDVIISPDVFGDGSELEVVNRFLFRDSEIEVICRRLYREVSPNGDVDRLYLESLVIELAALLLRRHSTASGAAAIPPSSGLTRNQARRVMEYIESRLQREITLRELGSIAGLSPYHFARMFKRAAGATPHQYIVERRVERAKAMLRSTDASLVDISLSVGFCSQSHFASTFKRIVGATPTEFRECSR